MLSPRQFRASSFSASRLGVVERPEHTPEHMLEQVAMPERQVFFSFEPRLGTAMREGDWKLQTRDDDIELYDLSRDIKETTNVAEQFPERAAEMKKAVDAWKRETVLDS